MPQKSRIIPGMGAIAPPLGQSIQGAINDMETIAMSHRTHEAEMIKAIAAAVQNLAIAEAHVRAMKVT